MQSVAVATLESQSARHKQASSLHTTQLEQVGLRVEASRAAAAEQAESVQQHGRQAAPAAALRSTTMNDEIPGLFRP